MEILHIQNISTAFSARFLTITVILVVFESFLWHDIGTSQPVDMSQLSALIPSSAADYRAREKE